MLTIPLQLACAVSNGRKGETAVELLSQDTRVVRHTIT